MADPVHAILAPLVPAHLRDQIDCTATLAELGLDGIDIALLAMNLEDALQIELDDEVVDGWSTVADVARSVERVRAPA